MVHSDYLSLLPVTLPEPLYTLILFRENQRVVTSRVAEKALDKLESLEPTVAFGPSFTNEAASALRQAGIQVISRSGGWFWTDESYEEIKTKISSRIKRPVPPQGSDV